MKKTIAVHSYKGGTGKTTIAANLAYVLAQKGLDVCILDLDFKAPSLHTIFHIPTYTNSVKCINDVLNNNCGIEDVIQNISHRFDTKGKLYVGFSNPQSNAIVQMAAKGKIWQTGALKQLINCRKHLYEMGIDIIILDTTPGVEYSSVNAIVAADYTLIVLKPDETGIEGSTEIIRNVYCGLNMDGGLIINQCVEDKDNEMDFSNIGLPVLEHIKCNCDISCKNELASYTNPDHDFSTTIERIATMILDSRLVK